MREFKPDKLPERDSGRWDKTSGLNEGGTVDEAGTSYRVGGEDVRNCWHTDKPILS